MIDWAIFVLDALIGSNGQRAESQQPSPNTFAPVFPTQVGGPVAGALSVYGGTSASSVLAASNLQTQQTYKAPSLSGASVPNYVGTGTRTGISPSGALVTVLGTGTPIIQPVSSPSLSYQGMPIAGPGPLRGVVVH